MKSPCLTCARGSQDKNSPECMQCENRILYADSVMEDDVKTIRQEKQEKKEAPRLKKLPELRDVTSEKKEAPKEQVKQCGKCLEEKPVSEFTADRRQRDGKDAYCRPCKSIHNKKTRGSKSGSEGVIRLDMSGFPELHKALAETARAEFRSPDVHVLYILSRHFKLNQ